MDDLTQYQIFVVAATLVGAWLKFQADYNKLSNRVRVLEIDTNEFKRDVKKLLEAIHEIKVLLAKNKVE
jgi:hypothetical protein